MWEERDLYKEIYVAIPPLFFISVYQMEVCMLKMLFYGLKQSPKAWFDKFYRAIVQFWYSHKLIIPCL